MKELFFWRTPQHDVKRWYGVFRAETDGNTVRYRLPIPTIRGGIALLVMFVVAVSVVFGLLGLLSAAELILEALWYGPRV